MRVKRDETDGRQCVLVSGVGECARVCVCACVCVYDCECECVRLMEGDGGSEI